jgi:hypothetical protein
MRNGDYYPSRMEAQHDAGVFPSICHHFIYHPSVYCLPKPVVSTSSMYCQSENKFAPGKLCWGLGDGAWRVCILRCTQFVFAGGRSLAASRFFYSVKMLMRTDRSEKEKQLNYYLAN